MMVEFVLVSFLAYNFPSYFDTEQELNAAVIIDKSADLKEDPYFMVAVAWVESRLKTCLLYTSPSPRDATLSRMPSSA